MSPNYIQHSAHIARSREGLFNLVRSVTETMHYEHRIGSPRVSSKISGESELLTDGQRRFYV
jgi:hypothetical protein